MLVMYSGLPWPCWLSRPWHGEPRQWKFDEVDTSRSEVRSLHPGLQHAWQQSCGALELALEVTGRTQELGHSAMRCCVLRVLTFRVPGAGGRLGSRCR